MSRELLIKSLLEELGEDPEREGLKRTPARYLSAFREMTSGYQDDPARIVGSAIFDEAAASLVVVRDIEFYSLCEHHLLPFFGKVHLAYLPDRKIIGLSKIPRLVKLYSRRLQVQERLTVQLVDGLERLLQPKGIFCQIEAQHLCLMMRGVQSQGAVMVTREMRGSFLDQPGQLEGLLSPRG